MKVYILFETCNTQIENTQSDRLKERKTLIVILTTTSTHKTTCATFNFSPRLVCRFSHFKRVGRIFKVFRVEQKSNRNFRFRLLLVIKRRKITKNKILTLNLRKSSSKRLKIHFERFNHCLCQKDT